MRKIDWAQILIILGRNVFSKNKLYGLRFTIFWRYNVTRKLHKLTSDVCGLTHIRRNLLLVNFRVFYFLWTSQAFTFTGGTFYGHTELISFSISYSYTIHSTLLTFFWEKSQKIHSIPHLFYLLCKIHPTVYSYALLFCPDLGWCLVLNTLTELSWPPDMMYR